MIAIHLISISMLCFALGLLIFFFIAKPLVWPITKYFSLKNDALMREYVRRSVYECIERQNKATIGRASIVAGI